MTDIPSGLVNRNLFSNHYLENFVQKNPEWEMNAHVEVFERQGWRYPYGPDTAPDCETQGGSNL